MQDINTENNKKEQETYCYKNDKEIFSDFGISLNCYFKPIFDSYNKDKKTFVLQIVNFLLVFLLSNFLLDWLIKRLTAGIMGSSMLGMRILLLLALIGGISAIKANKVARWQTLFKMTSEYTKKWLKRFLFLNAILYGIKEFCLYADRNKK